MEGESSLYRTQIMCGTYQDGEGGSVPLASGCYAHVHVSCSNPVPR